MKIKIVLLIVLISTLFVTEVSALSVSQVSTNKQGVVTIVAYDEKSEQIATGSGIVVGKDKVVTNFHVIDGAYKVSVVDYKKKTFKVTGLYKVDPDKDLAVLKVVTGAKPLQVGDSSKVALGENVVAIGSPLGIGSTVSSGIISNIHLDARGKGTKDFQISAPISKGSSGGALFNMKGQVVAVTYSTMESGQNLNFAISINEAKPYLKLTKLTNFPLKPYLDPTIKTLKFDDGDHYVGTVKNGLMQGKGSYYWVNGDEYTGDFDNGELSGQGTITYISGSVYTGALAEDYPNGKGKFTFINGDFYEGDFVDDKFHGKGTYVFFSGERYEGDFVNDYFQGKGTYHYLNGDKYVGDFHYDLKYGFGTLYDKNQVVIEDGYYLKGVFQKEQPITPTGIYAYKLADGKVAVQWNEVKDVDGYCAYYSFDDGKQWYYWENTDRAKAMLSWSTEYSCYLFDVKKEDVIQFKVTSVKNQVESPYSEIFTYNEVAK